MSHPSLPPMGPLLLRAAFTLGPRGAAPLPEGLAATFETSVPEAWFKAYAAYFGGFAGPAPLTALFPIAQRAQLALMLESAFPHAVPGMVHVAHAMRRVASIEPAAPFTVAVTSVPADDPARVAFAVTLSQGGHVVAEGQDLYQAGARKGPRGPRQAPEPLPTGFQEDWAIAADEGRRYAPLSGDYNPIHLSPVLARLFGFDRAIMHGMDAVARSLAAIERERGVSATAVEARFRRPIKLPASVRLHWAADGGFAVAAEDGAVRHLEGRVAIG